MALISRVKTWVKEVLTASDLNTEFNNLINNFTANKVVGSSADVSSMQSVSDPGELGTESLASSVEDEIKALRFMIKEITGEAQWYVSSYRTLDLVNDQIITTEITDLAVTTAKIDADAITGAKIADDQIDSEHYVAGSIDNEHLASSSVASGNIISMSAGKLTDFGQSVSVNSSTTGTGTLATVPSLTVNGLVMIALTAENGDTSATNIFAGTAGSCTVVIKRDATTIYTTYFNPSIASVNAEENPILVVDAGASGATVYTVVLSSIASGTLTYNFRCTVFHVVP